MKGSLMALCMFAAGIAMGRWGIVPADIDMQAATTWCLYLLIALIGILLGSNRRLIEIIKSISADIVVLPALTVVGTLTGCIAAWWLIRETLTLPECLSIGSGFGYYSLSSVLIIDLRQEAIGIDAATQLGALAVLANIMREMVALIGAPLIAKWFGPYAAVSAAGVTSMDVTLPVLTRCCGDRAVPLALFHGVALEICVPLLVTLFCML